MITPNVPDQAPVRAGEISSLVIEQWRLQIGHIARIFRARMALIVGAGDDRADVLCAGRGRLQSIPLPRYVQAELVDQSVRNGRLVIGHHPMPSRYFSEPIHGADGLMAAMLMVVSPLIHSENMADSCLFLLEETLRIGTRAQATPTNAAAAGDPVRWELFRAVVEKAVDTEPLALISADVDNLAQIITEQGEKAARATLAVIAKRIADCVEGQGLVCLIEEGRFLLLLREADSVQRIATFAQQVLHTGEEIVLSPGQSVHAVLSLGIASWREGLRDYDQLERQAHAAMYQARRAGGDRFVLFSEALSELAQPPSRESQE